MKILPEDIRIIQAMHQAGQVADAEQAYLAFLKKHPQHIEALHSLGVLYVQEDKLDDALRCFEAAVNVNPSNPILRLHLANVLKCKGLLVEAEKILTETMQAHPNFAATYNNLGVLYFSQEQWQLAVSAFQAAIEKQANYVDAYFNLGLALGKLKDDVAALHAYQATIELSPQHIGAQFQLGCLFMRKREFKQALSQFSVLHQAHPFHLETLMNMAACYLQLGWMKEAKIYYEKVLEIQPDDVQALFNLGVMEAEQGNVEQAANYYLLAVKADANCYAAHHNLGAIYLSLKKREQALHHFKEVLRLQPENEAVRYTIQVLTDAKEITTAPPAYVHSLFDSYASHYDAQVVKTLQYQVPGLFLQTLKTVYSKNQPTWKILDLGCGTGLCGEYVRPLADRLVGVDLSENMLGIAAKKEIYDELICADIVTYLQQCNQFYDVILAGDVLGYVGDLDEVFAAVKKVLTPNGLFLFTVEATEQSEFHTTSSGRFAHSQSYIERLIEKYQFTKTSFRSVTLRKQEQTAVIGFLFLLKT